MNKPLGLLLQEADLVSPVQIDMALQDQLLYSDLRLGEILALRGWLKQETADFFAENLPKLLENPSKQPLGCYLKSAGLLNETQIEDILLEQKHLGIRFGALAVLKGWVKPKTVAFFLSYLAQQKKSTSDYIGKRNTRPSIDHLEETMVSSYKQTEGFFSGEYDDYRSTQDSTQIREETMVTGDNLTQVIASLESITITKDNVVKQQSKRKDIRIIYSEGWIEYS